MEDSEDKKGERSLKSPNKTRGKLDGEKDPMMMAAMIGERPTSPIPLSPPSSPMSEKREVRPTDKKKDDKTEKDASSPINIPMSKAKTMITPGLEVTSLTSLSHIPASKFIVGRSHYTSQPITIEYYVTERMVDPEPSKGGGGHVVGPKVLKQATTIRSIGDYQIIRTIGSGSTGKVKLGVNIHTQRKVAIKIISKKYLNDTSKKSKETPQSRKRRILREAAILNLSHHPNIVKLYDLYVTDEYYCMVFEYVEGGQMLDYIINSGKMPESQAQKFFLQLLSAVSYCHENGIVHRDLKIENVLIDTKGDVKLVDFGLSNFYDPSDKLKTFCGSLYFAAPELLRGIVYTGPEIDVWSLGIILYVLVCGKVPFDDKSMSALHEKIKSGVFALPEHLSRECQNLLKSMIEVDSKRRARLDEILRHPWTLSGGNSVPNYFIGRSHFTQVNVDIEKFLVREFSYQFEEEEIRRILKAATIDWTQFSQHPIVALYYLAAQKQERQLIDPFSTSPQIPTESRKIEYEEAERIEIRNHQQHLKTNTIIPHSYDSAGISPIRKRTESLPATNIPKVMKSKRSSSIQGGPDEVAAREKDILFSIRESSDPKTSVINENSAPGNASIMQDDSNRDISKTTANNLMKVRTVYLRGIFSVNTTSTRSAQEIREIIINCLSNQHQQSIIYLDRESYFICEYQSSTIKRTSSINHEDDCEEANSLDDIDISQIDLVDEDMEATPNHNRGNSLTFGAAPLRSIRFEIHIVKVALIGLHGIQFKRISGDFGVYKNLCSQLITEFNL